MAGRDPEELLPLSPAAFHVLLAPAEGERDGYAIIKDVESRTEGRVRMGPGTLYGAIKRMLDEGLTRGLRGLRRRLARTPETRGGRRLGRRRLAGHAAERAARRHRQHRARGRGVGRGLRRLRLRPAH